eukprot:TRINITY_DN4808_c0_g1_i2.p1 TRINITY_DN4808_c0_g1~~TRINITY_DN4808_c0_g1_i2.p1  ORF type:complete len:339 (-),score=23.40 TRINITY_DN4808_c0_g1_i2:439-1311(-)
MEQRLNDETMTARQNLLAFLKGIGFDQLQLQMLATNGFDCLENLEALTVEMAIAIGIKGNKDAAALVDSKDSFFQFKSDYECSVEEALMNYPRVVNGVPLTNSIILQGAVNKKKAKEEKVETFLAKISSLSISGKGITDIVLYRMTVVASISMQKAIDTLRLREQDPKNRRSAQLSANHCTAPAPQSDKEDFPAGKHVLVGQTVPCPQLHLPTCRTGPLSPSRGTLPRVPVPSASGLLLLRRTVCRRRLCIFRVSIRLGKSEVFEFGCVQCGDGGVLGIFGQAESSQTKK